MADFSNLPDLDVAAGAFRTTYSSLLAEKQDRNGTAPDSAAATRAIAAWANLVDGAVAVIQERLAEASVDGVARVGDRRIYQATTTPEGAQLGSPGDMALSDAGTLYIKATGTETNTGWVAVASSTAVVTDHGGMSGLGDDDHTQYVLADGSRGLSADWDAGAHDISLQGELYVGAVSGEASTQANKLVIGSFSSPASGMSILSDTDTYLAFGRSGSPNVGGIAYFHSIDAVCINANNGNRLLCQSNKLWPVTDQWMEIGDATHRYTDIHSMSGTFYGTVDVGAVTYTDTDGNADEVLVTNGSGVTSFTDVNTLITPQTSSQDVTGGGTTATIDFSAGHHQRINLDAAGSSVALTLSNPVDGASYTIALVLEDDGETHATTWPGTVVWSGGTAPPSLDTTGSASWHNVLVRLLYNGTESRYYATWDAFSDA
jgi:hypothetical protein